MTQDEILKLAREAGIYHAFDSEGHWDGLTDVQLIERHPPHPKTIVYGEKRVVEILERFAKLVAEAEREACAKVCERDATAWGYDSNGAACAIAIRARGQA